MYWLALTAECGERSAKRRRVLSKNTLTQKPPPVAGVPPVEAIEQEDSALKTRSTVHSIGSLALNK